MDPRESLERARIAQFEGRYDDALREHLWFHENALAVDPALYGVRLSFALSDWAQLAQIYQPALNALLQTRDMKRDALLHGTEVRALFHDLASINQYLRQERETYELFRHLDATTPTFAADCAPFAIDVMLEVGDFELAAKYLPAPEEILLNASDSLNEHVKRFRKKPTRRAPVLKALTSIYLNGVRNCLEMLKGTKHHDLLDAAREMAVALVEDRAIRARVRSAIYGVPDKESYRDDRFAS